MGSERVGTGQRDGRRAAGERNGACVEDAELCCEVDERRTHLLGFRAQFAGFARRPVPRIPRAEGRGIGALARVEQPPENSGLPVRHDVLQHIADPFLRRGDVTDEPAVDHPFQPLRIAVGADRHRR